MWQLQLYRALDISAEREREAANHRLARSAQLADGQDGSGFVARLRRDGARAAAGVARRLDECVAREALIRADDQPVSSPS